MQLQKELEGVTTVAIAGHIRPDGDSVGACIGLWTYINDNYPQVEADMWLEKPDEKFSMIKGFSELREPDGEEREYDLFIAWIVLEKHSRLSKKPEKPFVLITM